MMRQMIVGAIYDGALNFVRQILPTDTDCTLRYNAASTATLTLPASHPVIPALMGEGMRAEVNLIQIDGNTLTKTRLVDGQIGDLEGSGPFGEVRIPVVDDWEWFSQILGWPKPAAAVTAQTDEYARYTGPSETRALAAIAANATRLGLPWNVPASAGRGTMGETEFRMHPLTRVIDALTADRLQLTLERDGDAWDVGIREGDTYARPLTPQSGVLASWRWARPRRRMTRDVVGGAGEGTARQFKVVVDTAAEAATGRVMEGFTDARMAQAGADLTPYGQQALADAAPKAGATLTLRETSWFRFPDKYRLGTRVHVQAGALPVEDVISEIHITHSAAKGLTVVPKVGFAVNDPQTKLTQFVAGMATSVRSMERR